MTDRVLVIEDEDVVRSLIVEVLEEAGFEVMQADRAERGLELIASETPSVVVSDIVMPGLSGLELLESVRASHPSLPVVLVTGAGTYGNLTRALSNGASGVVVKPFSHSDLVTSVHAALRRSKAAENEVRSRIVTPTVAAALADAIESRDVGVHGHCERLAELAVRIAEVLGLTMAEIEIVRMGALLHDVGKIGIPDSILLKPGALKMREWDLVRTHPLIGDNLLAAFEPLLEVRAVVRHHHERWDGDGYPDGLAGADIPLAARIVAVADSVEAMCAKRPYREPLTSGQILEQLREGRGTQWDSAVVDVVLGLVRSGELSIGTDGLRLFPRGEGSENGHRYSVLLVEDDDDLAALVAETIRRGVNDVFVIHASTIESAEKLAGGRTWSLAVLDHKLPDGSGLDLLERLHAVDPNLPVLMMTGEGSERVAVEAFRRGASDYVVKGEGTLLELQTRVRSLLSA